ncbi:MAG: ABC transporter ATP-binding protein [Candidatus Omnitrophica bacterium]|nr:ABC transporter ATP-binding protein [Candidatus Omnitrophota bacterium]
MANVIIKVENLIVDFENVTACKNLSFQVEAGEIFGLVGPNGAGKTTTLRVLATLQKPTSGSVKIKNFDLESHAKQIRKIIGFMPDFSPVYEELRVWEFLELYAGAYGIGKTERKNRIDTELQRVNLTEKKDTFIGELSRGMKQRLILAKTLLPQPEILLLDEPASGLDPVARKELSDILKDLTTKKTTIIISSHILTELSGLCTSIGIMEKGEMIRWGRIEELSDIPSGMICVEIKTLNPVRNLKEVLMLFDGFKNLVQIQDNSFEIILEGNESIIPNLIKFLAEKNIPVSEIKQKREDIQSIFFKTGAKDVS